MRYLMFASPHPLVPALRLGHVALRGQGAQQQPKAQGLGKAKKKKRNEMK